jgi:hypothetical protein
MATPGYIAALEQDPCWQATAEDKNGDHVVIMRGHPQGQSPDDYYLYAGDAYEASTPYSLREVHERLVSGGLTLLKGSIPNSETTRSEPV